MFQEKARSRSPRAIRSRHNRKIIELFFIYYFTKLLTPLTELVCLSHTKLNCIFHKRSNTKALDGKWNHRTQEMDRPSSSRARLSTRTSTWRLTELSWSVFFSFFLEERRLWRTNRTERRCARYCDWTSCRKSFFSLRRVDRAYV